MEDDAVKISIYDSYEELSQVAAELILEEVECKPNSVLSLASGDTPRLAYQYLASMARESHVDFSKVHFVSLDEWVGIPPTNSGSCYVFLKENVFVPLNISEDRIHFFDSNVRDLSKECLRINSVITNLKGIDLMLLGIGMNGHVGFNEPGISAELMAHVIELDEITRKVGQKYFNENTFLKQGITLGFAQIMSAGKIIMMANGKRKAAILKKVVEEEISTAIPASIIRKHPDSLLLMDKEAGEKLSRHKSNVSP